MSGNTKGMYHITPNGPRPCDAVNGGCPYAKDGGKHYTTEAQAQFAYDTKMNDKEGAFAVVSKKVNNTASMKISTGRVESKINLTKYAKEKKPVSDNIRALYTVKEKLNTDNFLKKPSRFFNKANAGFEKATSENSGRIARMQAVAQMA